MYKFLIKLIAMIEKQAAQEDGELQRLANKVLS